VNLEIARELVKMRERRNILGEEAPDFTLKDQNGKELKLSSFRGRKVILSFHPLAWTEVCGNQMASLEASKKSFDESNTIAVGLSVDSVPSKKAWARSLGIKETSLLADFWPHGEVSNKFDLFRDADGISERANVIIDENGKVAFVKIYDIPQLPDVNELIEFVKK
jgi:peroxiredoxin